MSAVSIAIVGRDEKPLYLREFPNKYWNDDMDPLSTEAELFGLSLSDREGEEEISENIPEKGNFGCSLRQQFILHSAIDRFTQLAGPPPGFNWRTAGAMGSDAMFVGLLFPIEDYRVYGYMTTTRIKIIIVVEDDETMPLSDQQSVDERIKALLADVHGCFVEYNLNPFTSIEKPIDSQKFNTRVEQIVIEFNRS